MVRNILLYTDCGRRLWRSNNVIEFKDYLHLYWKKNVETELTKSISRIEQIILMILIVDLIINTIVSLLCLQLVYNWIRLPNHPYTIKPNFKSLFNIKFKYKVN
jgi:hypothetical protein